MSERCAPRDAGNGHLKPKCTKGGAPALHSVLLEALVVGGEPLDVRAVRPLGRWI